MNPFTSPDLSSFREAEGEEKGGRGERGLRLFVGLDKKLPGDEVTAFVMRGPE